MVAPLLLGLLAGGAGLSLLSSGGRDAAVDVAGEVVEESFAVLGVGVVRGVQGMVRAIREEAKGHGVEITATITVGIIAYFFVQHFVKAPTA